MYGIGSKLSKHVLGMKFMRKTKDDLDETKLEEKHRQHFKSESNPAVSTSASSKHLETVVEEVPSYAQVIGYEFGRISFGGFNPTVEYNVERGKWKAVHVANQSLDDTSDTESVSTKRLKAESSDDEQDEPAYGSLIATCGKQFLGKKKMKDKIEVVEGIQYKKKMGWTNNRGLRFEKSRSKPDSRKHKSRSHPPAKKAKFMKPLDDFD